MESVRLIEYHALRCRPPGNSEASSLTVLFFSTEYNILTGCGVWAVNVFGAIILPATQLVVSGSGQQPMDQKGVEEKVGARGCA